MKRVSQPHYRRRGKYAPVVDFKLLGCPVCGQFMGMREEYLECNFRHRLHAISGYIDPSYFRYEEHLWRLVYKKNDFGEAFWTFLKV